MYLYNTKLFNEIDRISILYIGIIKVRVPVGWARVIY